MVKDVSTECKTLLCAILTGVFSLTANAYPVATQLAPGVCDSIVDHAYLSSGRQFFILEPDLQFFILEPNFSDTSNLKFQTLKSQTTVREQSLLYTCSSYLALDLDQAIPAKSTQTSPQSSNADSINANHSAKVSYPIQPGTYDLTGSSVSPSLPQEPVNIAHGLSMWGGLGLLFLLVLFARNVRRLAHQRAIRTRERNWSEDP